MCVTPEMSHHGYSIPLETHHFVVQRSMPFQSVTRNYLLKEGYMTAERTMANLLMLDGGKACVPDDERATVYEYLASDQEARVPNAICERFTSMSDLRRMVCDYDTKNLHGFQTLEQQINECREMQNLLREVLGPNEDLSVVAVGVQDETKIMLTPGTQKPVTIYRSGRHDTFYNAIVTGDTMQKLHMAQAPRFDDRFGERKINNVGNGWEDVCDKGIAVNGLRINGCCKVDTCPSCNADKKRKESCATCGGCGKINMFRIYDRPLFALKSDGSEDKETLERISSSRLELIKYSVQFRFGREASLVRIDLKTLPIGGLLPVFDEKAEQKKSKVAASGKENTTRTSSIGSKGGGGSPSKKRRRAISDVQIPEGNVALKLFSKAAPRLPAAIQSNLGLSNKARVAGGRGIMLSLDSLEAGAIQSFINQDMNSQSKDNWKNIMVQSVMTNEARDYYSAIVNSKWCFNRQSEHTSRKIYFLVRRDSCKMVQRCFCNKDDVRSGEFSCNQFNKLKDSGRDGVPINETGRPLNNKQIGLLFPGVDPLLSMSTTTKRGGGKNKLGVKEHNNRGLESVHASTPDEMLRRQEQVQLARVNQQYNEAVTSERAKERKREEALQRSQSAASQSASQSSSSSSTPRVPQPQTPRATPPPPPVRNPLDKLCGISNKPKTAGVSKSKPSTSMFSVTKMAEQAALLKGRS